MKLLIFLPIFFAMALAEDIPLEEEIMECNVCETGINSLDKELATPAVKNETRGTFLAVCTDVKDQESCARALDDHFPIIWTQIMSLLDGKQACTKLDLCTGDKMFALAGGNRFGQIGYNFCINVFTWFQNHILTEQALLNKIDNVCNVFPKQDYAQKCVGNVTKYGNQILQKTTQILGPDNICAVLKAFPSFIPDEKMFKF